MKTNFAISLSLLWPSVPEICRYNRFDFPIEILPGLFIKNKNLKSFCMFLILSKYFEAELFIL